MKGTHNGWLYGFAHEGMLRAARRLADRLTTFVAHVLQQHTSYRLVLTGHSLGAGTAALLCALWSERLIVDREEGEGAEGGGDADLDDGIDKSSDADQSSTHHQRPTPWRSPSSRLGARMRHRFITAECFAFACPCVLTLKLATVFSDRIVSCVLGDDVVPRLNLATATDLRDACIALHQSTQPHNNSDSADTSIAENPGGQTPLSAGRKASLRVLRTQTMLNAPKLFPAGKVLFLDPAPQGSDAVGVTELVDVSGLSEIRISRDMMSAHMPNRYLSRLTAIATSLSRRATSGTAQLPTALPFL